MVTYTKHTAACLYIRSMLAVNQGHPHRNKATRGGPVASAARVAFTMNTESIMRVGLDDSFSQRGVIAE